MHDVYHCSAAHPDLHSFPTRRSSDLDAAGNVPVQHRSVSREKRGPLLPSAPAEPRRLSGRDRWGFEFDKTLVPASRSEDHTSELQSHHDLVCRLLLEKKKTPARTHRT